MKGERQFVDKVYHLSIFIYIDVYLMRENLTLYGLLMRSSGYCLTFEHKGEFTLSSKAAVSTLPTTLIYFYR